MTSAANPPAFPRPIGNNGAPHYEDREISGEEIGMSLRDYFAAFAMAAFLDRASFGQGESSLQIDAARCYRIADAMLKERAK